MGEAATPPPARWAPAVSAGRHVAGWAVGSLIASFMWIIIIQQGEVRGWTYMDFVRGMGEIAGAPEDSLAKTGWYWTTVLWLAVGALIVVAERWAPGRGARRAPALSVIPFLLWGIPYSLLVDSRAPHYHQGLFGLEAGWEAPLLAAGASLVATLCLVRIYQLMRDAAWWPPKERTIEQQLAALQVDPSLELPEQRPEDRGEGART